jgi:hypothetical protein
MVREEIRVRPAVVKDIPATARVHVDAWRTTYGGFVPDEYLAGVSCARREGMWREVLGEVRDRLVA